MLFKIIFQIPKHVQFYNIKTYLPIYFYKIKLQHIRNIGQVVV